MSRTRILIIGAGGIGGLLTNHVTRAFAFSGLTELTGHLEVHLMDGDVVEERNLPHQPFSRQDVTTPKPTAIYRHLWSIDILTKIVGDPVTVIPRLHNFSAETDLSHYDLVVVAVDREEPRHLVHTNAKHWLDLRARGDGFVMWSSQDDPRVLDNLPKLPEGTSTSCQLDEAVETGNIQFGFALAAAHGAQWIVQWLRGESTPSGMMYSIHMGELPLPEISQELVE
jgi:molybdopterin/thiamine biosynthesis adenylyltransferase